MDLRFMVGIISDSPAILQGNFARLSRQNRNVPSLAK
jgi:hypothetical protein